jgi:hypothetical protein
MQQEEQTDFLWGVQEIGRYIGRNARQVYHLLQTHKLGEIGELIKALRDDGYAIKTVKHVRDAISRVFTFAMNPPRSYVPRNVLRDYPIKLPKSPKRKNKAEKHEASLLIQMAFNRIGTGGQRLSKTPCCIASTSALASLASVSETSIGASPWPI